ncbi:S41 family peptidase [Flavobacterium chungangense]|uniref:Peptidase S41 n=1 Tax=Flavobacterium chungangense TaxID=554283 RepID=A0A6V6Z9Z2_9FLAO|nr:S41 family peptidase [Flavobacterium chungangense]CAD0007742.1 peptidase S41 [Flavobacterium chungangense]
MKYSSHIRILAFLFLILSILSCQSDDSPVSYEKGSNQYTNIWIHEQMKKYYYWNEDLPVLTNLSLGPKEYFQKLLKTDDVYSYALHPELPETVPQSLRQKFGFDVSFMQYEGRVYGVILYTLYDSPAKNNGLFRGQLITKVDDVELNLSNYDNIYKSMRGAGQLNLQIVSYSAQSGFSKAKQVSLLQGFSFSQPVFHQVITENKIKIGYVEIPHFDVGQANLFSQIFQELKNQQIKELVLDLRYNGGGDISSATALSIILAPNIKSGDLFIQFEGNENGGIVKQSFQQSLESNESSVSFDALRNVHPNIQKLYVLCSKRTASASEIIINNLKPFMEVITIGEKTVGKDVAGFPIEDDRLLGKRGWILYPSIYKLFNSRHEGDYSKGINPLVNRDELQNPEIFPLGNHSEVLLKTAINTMSENTEKVKNTVSKSLPLSKNYTDVDPLLVTP